jgi:hypothetical protein
LRPNGASGTEENSEKGISMDYGQGAIVFGNWKLVPRDKLNWELYHLRASGRGFGDGTARWASEGRFYSWNTFPNALMYAADREVKDGTAEAARDIRAALDEYDRITTALLADMARALGGERE